jgi:hypothetical protein
MPQPVSSGIAPVECPRIGPRAVADYAPIRCLLEMDGEGNLAVIVQPGCSVADVHDLLRLLTGCGGQYDHLTFVDADEDR